MQQHSIKDSMIHCVHILQNEGYINLKERKQMLEGLESGDAEQIMKIVTKIEQVSKNKKVPVGA